MDSHISTALFTSCVKELEAELVESTSSDTPTGGNDPQVSREGSNRGPHGGVELDFSSRTILGLAVPALGALVIEPLLLMIDSIMVGSLGTAPLAGLSLASTILTTLVGVFVFLKKRKSTQKPAPRMEDFEYDYDDDLDEEEPKEPKSPVCNEAVQKKGNWDGVL